MSEHTKPSERYMIPWRGELEHRIEVLEETLIGTITGTSKPLVIAELEVYLEKLANYFLKRARENTRRSEKLDWESKNDFNPWDEYEQKVRSSYYFSGKADTYKRAAEKVRELLTPVGV